KLGAAATCNPMGAGKWRTEYAEFFRDAQAICIIADKDADGREHAQQVAAALAPVVRHVRIIELPGEGVKDASDFIAADHTIDEIYDTARAEPDWKPPASERAAETSPDDPGARAATNNVPVSQLFPEMADAAYYGLAGDIVRTIEPQTESDPVAILIQVL